MATRRRIGVSNATTEAARRQLMQPVTCWEKVWVTPEAAPSGSALKIYKWVRTEKIQLFSDDDNGADEPLAPLPDEPEVVEGDEEIDQEEAQRAESEAARIETTEPPEVLVQEPEDPEASKPPSPKPQLSMSLQTSSLDDTIDDSLKPLDSIEDVDAKMTAESGIDLDMSGLGPDGLALDGSHDLSQLGSADGLLGGPMLDTSIDPFAEPMGQD